MKSINFLIFLLIFSLLTASAQEKSISKRTSDQQIIKMLEQYKSEIRGPYRDLRWFCVDGTTLGPQERCVELGGVQRARLKDEVIKLGSTNHVFLGQILANTPNEEFWDADHQQSRLKQYQLEQFLRANDNGWINRRAQFYRGAYQIEDEEAWGIQFYGWLLEDRNRTADNFFIIRQSAKDIPHAAQTNAALNVRAISKDISDTYPRFMDLRVKIHGQPEKSDIQKVEVFRNANQSKLNSKLDSLFGKLLVDMKTLYKPVNVNDFKSNLKKLPTGSTMAISLAAFIDDYGKTKESDAKERCGLISKLALAIRQETAKPMKAGTRLSMIDASIKLESMLVQSASAWQPNTLRQHFLKIKTLQKAATGFGYLQEWELAQLQNIDSLDNSTELSLTAFNAQLENARRGVEWGTASIRASYQEVVKLYSGFEPLANGFLDDKVRASILLQLGSSVSEVGDYFSAKAGFSNSLMGIGKQSAARGLNPGYAMGELVVTNQNPDELEVSASKIYVFDRPPSDLKPVAGIATVTEGNMVSHVQLLARNLGIPNAVVSMENLTDLLPYNGKMVFYAVSEKGTVIIKNADEMTEEERQLFAKKTRNEDKITVPVELMELSNAKVLNLRDVNASVSGKICGPKAANLGQLKQMFPENVVEGLVIPFAIFKEHFDQTMTGSQSYWNYLNETFQTAEQMRVGNTSNTDIEVFVIARLDTLQRAIKKMPLKEEFKIELKAKFREILGKEIGQIPIFIRSDTNMEDLKDFTGAGLNLTLFNVLQEAQIMQGIKDVWASPYTERSYRWRQKYLLNPENVFPSILIIPSVNADCSGVLITKGVNNGKADDQTVAFNRGVGGAVEGQASETWLIESDGSYQLLAPAREPEYTAIPVTGGTKKVYTNFNNAILTESRLAELRTMSGLLREKLPSIGMNSPYDVELGFIGDKIWLFQVRPFVENKKAAASEYLQSISPVISNEIMVELDQSLDN